MTHRERVFRAINFETPDRVPMDLWIIDDYWMKMLKEKYGGMDPFLDELDVDLFMAFTNMPRSPGNYLSGIEEVLDTPWEDPNDFRLYTQVHRPGKDYYYGLIEAIERHKFQRGRVVLGWVVGVYEGLQGFLDTEQTLLEFALHKQEVREFSERLGDWSAQVAHNAIDLGADILLISDDWGQNGSMLFNPKDWYELILPGFRKIVQVGVDRGVPVMVHSDGFIEPVLDTVVELGVRILHPVQESAGMDQRKVRRKYGDRLCLYGGLDVRDLPTMSLEQIEDLVRSKIETLGRHGGWIMCTSHSVAEEISLDKILHAYNVAKSIRLA